MIHGTDSLGEKCQEVEETAMDGSLPAQPTVGKARCYCAAANLARLALPGPPVTQEKPEKSQVLSAGNYLTFLRSYIKEGPPSARETVSLLSARCSLCLGLFSLIFLLKIKVDSNFSHQLSICVCLSLFFYSLSDSLEYAVNTRCTLTACLALLGKEDSVMGKTDVKVYQRRFNFMCIRATKP